ncbi:MAG TPA: MerR family transcriptional regulator [Candidatus Pullichristensenella stercorigallinarum]|uniref:MerR family transcriptional regulator n=1 Tax=Candidatus Pullichristensenella stercorigallinarum TaxID=2840909 RepID=A0A9D0ZL28_9FIRM|nr:MerR family transcriptional regulator [Candidatus Pullichristensenella stercorigallinarum]
MLTVGEVSRLTGVSVRTLHHYDAIGLLKPTRVTEAGYRLYDEAALVRLQAILLLREVRFPLGEIKAMLDSPGFCPGKALAQRIELLETQRRRLGELIALARAIQQKGVWAMEVQAFDMRGMDRLRAEAKARWGATAAYRHYAQREGSDGTGRTEQWRAFFAGLGALRHLPPDDQAVREKIGALRAFIAENYYPCDPETLRALGELYANDGRFRRYIDNAGGEGTAAFANQAIAAYCAI